MSDIPISEGMVVVTHLVLDSCPVELGHIPSSLMARLCLDFVRFEIEQAIRKQMWANDCMYEVLNLFFVL